MPFFLTFLLAALLGYIYGYRIRPNMRFQNALQEMKEKCLAALVGGRRGVYKTIVTDNLKSSELVVEVQELALTQAGQVKVQYINAFYKNPDFRTRKGNALLEEVHGLLGDYLPLPEIEWYEEKERNERIKEFIHTVDTLQGTRSGRR